MAVDDAHIDKLLEQVLDYSIEFYNGSEVVGTKAEVARGDERAYVKFDDAFMSAHYMREYPDADRMCLRSRLVGELVCFSLKYEAIA